MRNADEFDKTIIITGGAGFIGANLAEYLTDKYPRYHIVVFDSLTYAGNEKSLDRVRKSRNFTFEKIDLRNSDKLSELIKQYRPEGIIHLAAETHVDRSIKGPAIFLETNIIGTFNLLECTRQLTADNIPLRFHHVSTDEVFGAEETGRLFTEQSKYFPNSPYAATKASADHLVRAWHQTYRLDTVTTNCGNNFGPYQYPEKLIPLAIYNAMHDRPIPVYGDGKQVRDWIYVRDHCRGIDKVFHHGKSGESYNIGARCEIANIDLLHQLCDILDQKLPEKNHRKLLKFVEDRPGHDRRYAIDPAKIENELDWKPEYEFSPALAETVEWYLNNPDWLADCLGSLNDQNRTPVGGKGGSE